MHCVSKALILNRIGFYIKSLLVSKTQIVSFLFAHDRTSIVIFVLGVVTCFLILDDDKDKGYTSWCGCWTVEHHGQCAKHSTTVGSGIYFCCCSNQQECQHYTKFCVTIIIPPQLLISSVSGPAVAVSSISKSRNHLHYHSFKV